MRRHIRFFKLVKDIGSEAMADDVMDWSAALAYYFLFSLFPLVVLLAAMLGALHLSDLVNGLLVALGRVLPHEAWLLVNKQLTHVLESRHTGLISVSTVLVLYSASTGFSGLMSALNAAYEVPETRPYYKRLLTAIGLTCTAGLLMVLALAAMLFGHKLLTLISLFHTVGPIARILWPIGQWLFVLLILLANLMLLYRVAPNVRHQNTGFIPAAGTALVLWMAISAGLGFYINHFSNYSAIYGSLGALIGLMMWFYFFAISLLIGAEVHSEILKQKGIYCKPKRQIVKEPEPPVTKKAA